jgi:hypothetical protein
VQVLVQQAASIFNLTLVKLYNYYTDRQYIQGGSNSGTRGIGLGAFLTGFANKDIKAPETQKQILEWMPCLLQNRFYHSV